MAGEKKVKKKGLGGLSPEKKRLLKQLIMQKATEDLKKQQEMDVEEKRAIIETRVEKFNIDGLDEAQLRSKVKSMYKLVCNLEEEKYDWELKLRKQEYEISELTIKVNDIKGKFVKPILKKVAKAETRLAKFDKEKLKSKLGFRDQLKSTGQPKFALEEKEEPAKKPDWSQDVLKHKEGEEGGEGEEGEEEGEAAAEEEAAEEEAAEEEEAEEEEEEE